MQLRAALIAPAVGALVVTGGIGNFYNHTSCSPAYHRELVAKVTNYDINRLKDQRYHHSGNSYNGYYVSSVAYDGHPWPVIGYGSIGHSGTARDGYQSYGNPIADHVLYMVWKNGKGGVLVAKCRAI
jgi:hypothetical protein